MKKLLFTIGAAILTLVGSAQLSGTITGTIRDSINVGVPGIAVLILDDTDGVDVYLKEPTDLKDIVYTDFQGNYQYSYSNFPSGDTLGIGVVDCNGNFKKLYQQVYSSGPTNQNLNLNNICRPNECDVILRKFTTNPWPNGQYEHYFEAFSLVDSNYISPAMQNIHEWTFSTKTVSRQGFNPYGPNYDTVSIRTLDSIAPTVCYKRTTSCSNTCLQGSTLPPPALNCNASFFVDTINSINFQGQVVLWNNSTTDTSATYLNYIWDFGDGNFSSQQYPSHTYADTGIYYVCLTIVSFRGNDSCMSTYCTNVGFDANGNLIFKTNAKGFTINVINPATVGLLEKDVFTSVNLYPNPSRGVANLKWDDNLDVQGVKIISLSGKILQELNPTDNKLEINNLDAGIYIIQIATPDAAKTMRLVVE